MSAKPLILLAWRRGSPPIYPPLTFAMVRQRFRKSAFHGHFRKRHAARRTEPDFGGLAMPAIQEHPSPTAVWRNREIKAATVSMAPVLGDRCHSPSVKSVDFPRLVPPSSALARALASAPVCSGRWRAKKDGVSNKCLWNPNFLTWRRTTTNVAEG